MSGQVRDHHAGLISARSPAHRFRATRVHGAGRRSLLPARALGLADGGWLSSWLLDFAAHRGAISAGVSALVLALMLGPRRDLQKASANNLVLTLTEPGCSGSVVRLQRRQRRRGRPPGRRAVAGLAFTTTQSAAAAAGLA